MTVQNVSKSQNAFELGNMAAPMQRCLQFARFMFCFVIMYLANNVISDNAHLFHGKHILDIFVVAANFDS